MIQNIRHSNIHAGILFEYIRYLYKSGKAFEEMLPILLKSNDFDLKGLRIKDEREFSKLFLNLVLKYQSGVKALREDTPKTTEIVLAVIQWNKNYTNDTIVVCEQKAILDTIKKALTTDDWYYREKAINILNYMVCHENIPEDFLDIYFNHLDQLRSTTINRWFLKYNPNVFTENIDKIIECMFMFTGYDLMKFLKKYEHNGLVQNIVRLCLQKLKNSEGDNYHEIANLLAFLMPRTEFLKLLDEYVPSIDKLNITESTEEEKNILKIQIALANSVRFSSYNMDALPILLKYCKGDCLQPALHSLYKCFSKTPENNLRPLMNVLLNKSVSFRKHTIFLAAMAFPIKINEDLCNKMISDKNESIQKHLFTSSYKYF
ncbi:hypothetical protein HHI36_009433 [Cryptolaemus montrouzieri]|uniref:Uncharacterized protein n=1 Tax=Cryptolaemus montrouzieri TaxID=559131 RepID=A0ABD2MFC5_9CUCU